MSMTYHEQLDRKNTLKLQEWDSRLSFQLIRRRFFPRGGK